MKIVDDWIREGRLGEINTVHGIFDFKLEDNSNVRLVPEYGGGSLWDIGIYPLSFAQFVFGGPPSLVSGLQTLGTHGVDDTFVGQMRYPGGGLAQISSSFRSPFHTHVDIVGTQGRLQLTRPFVTVDEGQVTFYPAEGDPETIEVPSKELYLGEVEDMHAAILDGAEPLISLEESRDQVRTALALYASARSGQMVAL
jgi:predicted dehydrogenase